MSVRTHMANATSALKDAELAIKRSIAELIMAKADANASEVFTLKEDIDAFVDDIENMLGDKLYESLAGYFDSMPDEILGAESHHCESCPYAATYHGKVAIGDSHAYHRYLECTAQDSLDCPAVKACGFTKEEN